MSFDDDDGRETEDRRPARSEREMKAATVRADKPTYKFQRLEVYQLALEYLDLLYDLTKTFPAEEKYNLTSQLKLAGTSIVLNIAEGSTGQGDAEQYRFLGFAMRSYLETVACLDIAERRAFVSEDRLHGIRELGHRLFTKLLAFRGSLKGAVRSLRSSVSSQ
jgi:four helix bundle protein